MAASFHRSATVTVAALLQPTTTNGADHDDPAHTTTQPTTTPLLRAFSPGSGDHFYTTSAAERDKAVANLGYVDEGIVGHI